MTPAHVIYVVIGECGEYSDNTQWPVLWRHTKEDAEVAIDQLNREALEFKRIYDASADLVDVEAYRATMLDPSFASDYTGTKYHVWAIADDPRAERLS